MPSNPAENSSLAEAFASLVVATVPLGSVADRDFADEVLPYVAENHAAFAGIVERLAMHPSLRRLLVNEGFQCSTGIGYERLTAPALVHEMVIATWRRLEISGRRHTHQALRRSAIELFGDTHRLAGGNVVEVPACFLFDGPRIAQDRRLHGDFGAIRYENDLPRPWVEAPRHSGLMLYTRVPVRVTAMKPGPDPGFWGSSNPTQRAVDRIVSQVRLALLDDDESGPPARLAQIDISVPWSWGHFQLDGVDPEGTWEDILNPRAFERRLDFYWQCWRPEVDLAALRLAASTDEGRRSDDALVDAVTAWESLLGSRTETTFRVTASLAKLLRSTLAERESLMSELKKIYAARSDAVHGAKDLTIDEGERLDAMRQRAVRIGAEAVRALLGERSDLLDLKSEQRSVRILLDSTCTANNRVLGDRR